MSRRFVLDLSDLYTFLSGKGDIAGIQRLLLNVVTHRDVWTSDEIVLGHWNPLHRRYLVFPFPETFGGDVAELKRLAHYPKIDPFSPQKHEGDFWKRQVYRRRRDAQRFWNLNVVAPMLRSYPGSRVEPLPLREGDVLLSLGVGWNDQVLAMFDWLRPMSRTGTVAPIVLIHDLIPFVPGLDSQPEWKIRVFESWFDGIAQTVDRFLVYSEATREVLREQLAKRGRDGARIERFPLAHETLAPPSNEESTISASVTRLAEGPYALAVGPIKGRKNGNRLVEAWARLRDRIGVERLPTLVFAGAVARDDIERDLDAELEAKIALVHRPADRELEFLYRNALFCVHPSVAEGWGLPVGEALWNGKLSVTSSVSSMPEVGGPLADYFDPTDIESMATALERPITDRSYLAEREAQIGAADLRSWRDATKLLFKAATRLVD